MQPHLISEFLYVQARRVLDLIRGRSYEEALMILEYTPWKACEPILKVLVSVSLLTQTDFQVSFSLFALVDFALIVLFDRLAGSCAGCSKCKGKLGDEEGETVHQ